MPGTPECDNPINPISESPEPGGNRTLWLPDRLKDRIVATALWDFRVALPGIDFSGITPAVVDRIGLRMRIGGEADLADVSDDPGTALEETLTELTAVYVTGIRQGIGITPEFFRYAANSLDGTPMQLLSLYIIDALEEAMQQSGQSGQALGEHIGMLIGKAYLTGNLSELEAVYSEGAGRLDQPAFADLKTIRNTDGLHHAADHFVEIPGELINGRFVSDASAVFYPKESADGLRFDVLFDLPFMIRRFGSAVRQKTRHALAENDFLRYADPDDRQAGDFLARYATANSLLDFYHEFTHVFSAVIWAGNNFSGVDRIFL
ncbi:hypothetical protein A2Z33_02015 [Candidatus Gottesmanbacteria bacterium RBG_16_52_11]|uniref:Uncharacterized protein n=1 Tax=Candidatus Gottesmanbacteria bacterium RBG_16_52_11 TaxID=1798374 RepID=A0A1F5YQT5_9BACT|nr:MAG: hypothetical protein A2Z33_02015 [Candidatus Gottesmanbacteria bacterium RBG_16_52_11]